MPGPERDDQRERQDAPVDADERAILTDARQAGGVDRSSARMPTTPNTSPSTPPASDSTTLSVSSCRMMRPRRAPMAARMAISRLRPVARDEQQVRDVRARDQQHEADGAGQDEQRRADVAHEHLANRLDREAPVRPERVRELRAELRRPTAAAALSPDRASRPASAGRRPGSSAPGRCVFGSSWNGIHTSAADRIPRSRMSAEHADDRVGLAARVRSSCR